ncbi:MAG: sulfatase-like hydrolase/transferase [Verrucomicrobia bacterium]|nr:sulfatase-like hydrolase/transferase [Verrucomicrobiota bacterium]
MKAFTYLFTFLVLSLSVSAKTNVILVMADDQGWGQTGYYNHPVLKTPNLDAMASNGLRFDRFYAGGPVCSPTRATVLTGRTHDRTGVFDHGYALRDQEKTIAQAMKKAGYATGHFGKWHLNGLRGPGVPILGDDSHAPGAFGFDTWLSVTNFFDLNPVMSRQGVFEDFKGDSSEIIVGEALKFITKKAKAKEPFFTVIWYGTPHSPWMAEEVDQKPFTALTEKAREHYGELVAMDRSIGTLRKGLRDLGIETGTLVWFTSDNGGLPGFKPSTTGGLRGFKSSMYEGGLRVPAIIEWPSGIPKPRITKHPAGAVDIFPTIAGIVGLPESSMLQPQDGLSLVPLLEKEIGPRKKPLIFRSRARIAIIDNDWKLLSMPKGKTRRLELYNLVEDTAESSDLFGEKPEVTRSLRQKLAQARSSIDASVAGKDYPSNKVNPQPPRIFWTEVDAYKPYFKDWKNRPEYESRLKRF